MKLVKIRFTHPASLSFQFMQEMESDQTTEETILEINLISAQNLKTPPFASSSSYFKMHTYAVAWVDPRAKLRSHVDRLGGPNPTWNDKFLFRVSPDFIHADTSAVQFHIYSLGYIRDSFIGTVRYILSTTCRPVSIGIPGFSALHIRRPSGTVHGVLNIAATLYSSSDFPSLTGISAICVRDLIGVINKSDRQPRLSRSCIGYKRSSEQSSHESCELSCEESVCVSDDETESTTSSLSFTTITAFRDGPSDVVKKSDGGSLLCGLLSPSIRRPKVN